MNYKTFQFEINFFKLKILQLCFENSSVLDKIEFILEI